MFLFHNTNIESLNQILKDGGLKSLNLQKLSPRKLKANAGEGSGLYTNNNFVYFSCTDKLNDNRISGRVTLFFTSDVLSNRVFYTSDRHTTTPDLIRKSEYRKKYKKGYRNYRSVLKKLYLKSISKLKDGNAFQIFQQIALRGNLSLKNLVAIKFNTKTTKNILTMLARNYPNIILV